MNTLSSHFVRQSVPINCCAAYRSTQNGMISRAGNNNSESQRDATQDMKLSERPAGLGKQSEGPPALYCQLHERDSSPQNVTN